MLFPTNVLKSLNQNSVGGSGISSSSTNCSPVTLTTTCMLPLVLATGAGAEARVVMGVALLGGMSVATVLGVLYYPMLFIFIGKLAGYEKKRDAQMKADGAGE